MTARKLLLALAFLVLMVGSSGCDRRRATIPADINAAFTIGDVRVAPESVNAYIAEHRGFTSRGGQMRCAYVPLGQAAKRVFVWAHCLELLPSHDGQELLHGSGMSLPVALTVETQDDSARIVGIEFPQDGNRYTPTIRRIFPASLWPTIFSHGETENARSRALAEHLRVRAVERFRLPLEAAHAPPREPGVTVSPPSGCGHHSGRFALVVDGDTTVIDEYTRNDTLLRGVVRPRRPTFGWAEYTVRYGRDGRPMGAVLRIGRPGTEVTDSVGPGWRVTIDSGVVTEVGGSRPARRVVFAGRIVPQFGPSIAMHQEVLREARSPTAARQADTVTVFSMAGGGEPHQVILRRTAPDTVRLRQLTRDPSLVAEPFILDSCGNLIRSETSDGRYLTVRTR